MCKLKILKWEDCPRVSRLAQCNHKGPYKGKDGGGGGGGRRSQIQKAK